MAKRKIIMLIAESFEECNEKVVPFPSSTKEKAVPGDLYLAQKRNEGLMQSLHHLIGRDMKEKVSLSENLLHDIGKVKGR